MSSTGITMTEAVRITGATVHQLRYWSRIGLVRGSVKETGGKPGVRRLYSEKDVEKIGWIVQTLGGPTRGGYRRSLQSIRRTMEDRDEGGVR